VNRRDAMIRAHKVASLTIRGYLDNADELVEGQNEENQADADKIEAALLELADRHDCALLRMTASGS